MLVTLGYSNQEVQRTCSGCELESNHANGIFNLKVKEVKLGEDEYFECQVSPGKGSMNSIPLRSSVKINIQGENFFVIYILKGSKTIFSLSFLYCQT